MADTEKIYHSKYTAAQIENSIGKMPDISASGEWEIWNVSLGRYVLTGVNAHGKSAYELAVENGYTGTEEEWITAVEANRTASETAARAAQAAATSAAANVTHYPKIVNTHWYVWDADAGEFVDTGISAEGQDGVGVFSFDGDVTAYSGDLFAGYYIIASTEFVSSSALRAGATLIHTPTGNYYRDTGNRYAFNVKTYIVAEKLDGSFVPSGSGNDTTKQFKTSLVIGNTANGHTKDQCDYLCDGDNDDDILDDVVVKLDELSGYINEIHFLPGFYYFTRGFSPNSDTIISGSGMGFTNLVWDNNDATQTGRILTLNGSHCTVKDISFIKNRGVDVTGIEVYESHCMIENCEFKTSKGILLSMGTGSVVQNCVFDTVDISITLEGTISTILQNNRASEQSMSIVIDGGNNNNIICNKITNEAGSEGNIQDDGTDSYLYGNF